MNSTGSELTLSPGSPVSPISIDDTTEDTIAHNDALSPDYTSYTQRGSENKTSKFSQSVETIFKKHDHFSEKHNDAANSDPVFGHLPKHEQETLREQLDLPPINVSFRTLYRFASRKDLLIIVISAICAVIGGAALPIMTVVYGSLAGTFSSYFNNQLDYNAFNSKLSTFTLYFVYIGVAEFVTVYIASLGFVYTGEHITQNIREQYLAAVLRQNIAFFDKLGAGEITARITGDMNLIQDGISEKMALTLHCLSTFVTAFVVGFSRAWKLALILLSTVVALTLVMASSSKIMVKYSKRSSGAYALSGTVAEEVISSIRNAVAFGTQDKLAKQYEVHLREGKKSGLKVKVTVAVMLGGFMCIFYLNYALGFWQGSRMVLDGEISLSAVLTVVMSLMMAAFHIGQIAPNIQAFTSAVAAASRIYTTIDRISPLDPDSGIGLKLGNFKGNIELRNVKHIYPSRPETVVMKDVSLVIPAGKTTALVGSSGSGKSTIIGLLERFYNPVGGEVLFDGHDVRTLNLRWLRHQISLVSQEPTLFATTIEDNIRQGLTGTRHAKDSIETQNELIIRAAKTANAHDFITRLPEGYKTNVGQRGFQLSGGQKQRIAIARAIVSDPKILLLDEATSALDTASEEIVQAALNAAAEGRTTVVVAHRLSTIKTAENIVVMSKGQIAEQGTHDELVAKGGDYYKLVEAQRISAKSQPGPVRRHSSASSAVTPRLRRRGSPIDDSFWNKRYSYIFENLSLAPTLEYRTASTESQSYGLWELIKVVGSFNKKEPGLMLFGLFWSIIAGGGNPTQAVFFAKIIQTLSLPIGPSNNLQSKVDFWALMYLMLAFVQLLSFTAQGVAFAICSERLVLRARKKMFRTILRQDIAFFDREENTAGRLTSSLATNTTSLAGLSGSTLGTILVTLTTLIGAIVVSLSFGWKLALVCTSTVPVLLGCGFFRVSMLVKLQARSKQAYEESASYACEAVSAIKTVASLTREEDVWKNYHDTLEMQTRKSLKFVIKSSAVYAASQSLIYFCIALAFWYGGTLIARHEYDMFQFFLCFSAIVSGSQSAGNVFSFASDIAKAKDAAGDMKNLFDRKPEIDTWSDQGESIERMIGHVEFRKVQFRYPTRPDQTVLKGLSLKVRPGQYVALVGASGCGKSTTIQLLERFYDPTSGNILVDGKDISSYNINDYRSCLALVSQEPTLYQGSIWENILLGVNKDDVSEERVVKACKDANIYDFITSLPNGFSTIVGSKGCMLSGGQKQRVAIARALLRNPRILLLDEATSALDSESEKLVQVALDTAAKGRTTIAVAHRLSSIQKADVIYVFDQGRIVESGTHSELLRARGKYFELANLQSLAGQGEGASV